MRDKFSLIQTVYRPGPLVGLGTVDLSPSSVGDRRYKFRSVAGIITTDATVANRPAALRISGPDGTEYAVLIDATVQAASLTINHYWFPGPAASGTVATTYALHVVPNFILEPGWKCFYVGLNAQAGDSVGPLVAIWEQVR